MFGRLAGVSRNFVTSAVRRGHEGGVIGSTLPFDIKNRYKLTALFTLYFGSGLAIPFLIVRFQLLKK